MKKKKLLFIGHDLKFLKLIVNHFSEKEEYEVKTFSYPGHNIRDHKALAQVLPGIDLIFCEWGLGNLNWLSKNKFADQKLIVRVHLQEFVTQHLEETHWQHVDRVILVGPDMVQKFRDKFPPYSEKAQLIYNIIDTDSFDLGKEKDNHFHIGMLGILPMRKAPHLGFDLLQELKMNDKRFKIFIKSKRPEELDWLYKREEEREYYDNFYETIDKLNLKDSVIFDPHGSHVQEWFQKIGFVLSPSEFESFHMAIPEGMASGAIPVIRNWEGADMIYPQKYIFRDINQAAGMILKFQDEKKRIPEAQKLKAYAKQHFGMDVILRQYEQVFNEVLAKQESSVTSPQLRGIYSELQQEQSSITESLKAKENEAVENLKALKRQVEEKEYLIENLQKVDQQSRQTIEKLNNDIIDRNRKIDTIVSLSDEMKRQLVEGRLREKKKDTQIQSLNEDNLKLLQDISGLKINISELQAQIKSLETSNIEKDHEISGLLKSIDLLNSEKDILLNEISEKDGQIGLREQRIAVKDRYLAETVSHLDALSKEVNTLKELLGNEQNQTRNLQQKAQEQELMIKNLGLQTKDLQQYIKYLETRFLNKMIGIVRNRIKKS